MWPVPNEAALTLPSPDERIILPLPTTNLDPAAVRHGSEGGVGGAGGRLPDDVHRGRRGQPEAGHGAGQEGRGQGGLHGLPSRGGREG